MLEDSADIGAIGAVGGGSLIFFTINILVLRMVIATTIILTLLLLLFLLKKISLSFFASEYVEYGENADHSQTLEYQREASNKGASPMEAAWGRM